MPAKDPLWVNFDAAGMRRRTVHGAGATAVGQALKFALQFGSQLALARLLDPAQFGLVAMVLPVLGLAMALNDFGLGQAIVQRTDITHRQVSALFWLSLAIGTGMTLLATAGAPLLAEMYDEPRTLGITLAAASLILLSTLSVVPMALLNRQLRFVTLAVIEVTAVLAGAITGIVAARAGLGYWSLVLMQAVNAGLTMVLAWACCGWRPSRPAREPGVSSLLRFGAHIMASNLAAHLATSADNIVVGIANGKVALGLYDRSYNLVVKPLWQLMAPASRLAVPLLSRLQGHDERYARAYLLMVQLATVACVPGLIAASVVAEPLIGLLLGPKWSAMPPVFVWICLGSIASPLASSTYWLFVTQNRTGEQMRLGIITALISVASFIIGAWWGVVGVAMVAALGYVFVQTPLLLWQATKRGPVTLAMLQAIIAPMLGAGVVAALATAAFLQAWTGSRAVLLVLSFGVAYAAFGLALIAQPAGRRLARQARDQLMPGTAAVPGEKTA
jgi:polysaccharide transporter, PST family